MKKYPNLQKVPFQGRNTSEYLVRGRNTYSTHTIWNRGSQYKVGTNYTAPKEDEPFQDRGAFYKWQKISIAMPAGIAGKAPSLGGDGTAAARRL